MSKNFKFVKIIHRSNSQWYSQAHSDITTLFICLSKELWYVNTMPIRYSVGSK